MDPQGIEIWKRLAAGIKEPAKALVLIEQATKVGDDALVPALSTLSRPENEKNFTPILPFLEKTSRELVVRLIAKESYEQLAVFVDTPRNSQDTEKLFHLLLENYKKNKGNQEMSSSDLLRNEALRPHIQQLAEEVDLKGEFERYFQSDSILPMPPLICVTYEEKLDFLGIPLLRPPLSEAGELGKETTAAAGGKWQMSHWEEAARRVDHFSRAMALLQDSLEQPPAVRAKVLSTLIERSRSEDFEWLHYGAGDVAKRLLQEGDFSNLGLLAAAPGSQEGKEEVLRALLEEHRRMWRRNPSQEAADVRCDALQPIFETLGREVDLDRPFLSTIPPSGERVFCSFRREMELLEILPPPVDRYGVKFMLCHPLSTVQSLIHRDHSK